MIKRLLILAMFLSLVGCSKERLQSDVYYEIFVASFYDTNNDQTGDLNGITAKLDYLKDLGIGGLWLMPIHPGQTYHKYDVDDYFAIDDAYGSMEDFKNLISSAEEKDIDIIIDLVLNHTSDTHPWFLEAKENFLNDNCDMENSKCDYYNFSHTKESGYVELKEGYYYEARFWNEMPDLNLDSENVRNEIKKIVGFWLDLGVKGFRLDAVLYYYSNNVEKNNEFVSWLNGIVKEKKSDAFMVGEVYSSDGMIKDHYKSNIDSLFDFPISSNDGLIFKAINAQDGLSLANRMVKNLNAVSGTPSLFISNHDQSRNAGYFNTLDKQKLAAALYLLSPGIPFIYYGEEIGMKGSGKDENKRLAMLWGEGNDVNNPVNSDYSNQIDSNVKMMLKDKDSLLNYYKKIIYFRNKYINDYNDALVFEVDKRVFSIDYGDIIVMVNLSEDTIDIELDTKILEKIKDSSYENNVLSIRGYDVLILESKG